MPGIQIDNSKCDLCGKCAASCPFQAIEIDKQVKIGAGCKLCKLCVKACPNGAVTFSAAERQSADKSAWRGILVFAEPSGSGVHPVTKELIGEARRLAQSPAQDVYCVYIGGEAQAAESLSGLGAKEIFVYADARYEHFTADSYADAFSDCIKRLKPSVVLVGATPSGRSLAPRVAARFRTGLTADCTKLGIKENTDLVQTRPAFGGNIMAQIITPYTRPQFATVRYKVMDKAEPCDSVRTKITVMPPCGESAIRVLSEVKKSAEVNISDADVIVAVGRGLKSENDLGMVRALADALGAQLAGTRPMIEAGVLPYTHQIGLSGRTVKPKLIITCGISGAVQFAACMNTADCIIAINSDKSAPIFNIAHYCIVGDMYEIIPRLTAEIRAGKGELSYV